MYQLENIKFIHFDTIDSTNTWAKKHYYTLSVERITCITASEQTAGKGRLKRSWFSPKNENIYATLFFCIPKEAPYLINVTQMLALASIQVLETLGFKAQIKWPNDLLVQGKKIGGILCETLDLQERWGMVLGLGLNVNMKKKDLLSIDNPATSLDELSGHYHNPDEVLSRILKVFVDLLNRLQKEGFAPFHLLLEKNLAFKGETISFYNREERVVGTCDSLTEDGRLNVVLPSGETKTFASGDVIAGNFRRVKDRE